VHRQALGAVLLGIAPVLDLLQRGALGGQLDDLEFEQPEPAVEAQAKVQPTVAAGVFAGQVEAEGGQVAVEDAGVEALEARDLVAVVPLVRDGGEQADDVLAQGRRGRRRPGGRRAG
jgi:hypothetical protein